MILPFELDLCSLCRRFPLWRGGYGAPQCTLLRKVLEGNMRIIAFSEITVMLFPAA